MAPVTAQRVPGDMAGHNRDVADLWKDALKAYKGIVGFDLERKFESVEAMITQGTKEMQSFHKFRYDGKKVDKLGGLFSANLDYMRRARNSSEQLPFLQRIVILVTRLPKYNVYQNCLMDVFTSFLAMCGFAHKQRARRGSEENGPADPAPSRGDRVYHHGQQRRDPEDAFRAAKEPALPHDDVRGADDMAKLLRAFNDQQREQSKQYGSGEQKGKPSAAEHGKPPSAKGI
ncbi:hypothetical protein N0V92_009547 [Colletotrichum tropicale]|nr:hypothetical protein N0V92_009547 [Colletotrichum tropicale]